MTYRWAAAFPVALAAVLASCAPRPAEPCPDARLPATVAPVDALAAAGPPPTTAPAEPLAVVTLDEGSESAAPQIKPGPVCVLAGDGFKVECRDDGSAALIVKNGTRVALDPGREYRLKPALLEAAGVNKRGDEMAALVNFMMTRAADPLLVRGALAALPGAVAAEVRRLGPDGDALLPLAHRLLEGPVTLTGRNPLLPVTATVELTPAGRRALADAIAARGG